MNQTVTIGEATYRFGADGYMVTGWDKTDGVWSYYNAYGARVNGWVSDGGTWYYLEPSTGAMATGWTSIAGRWYYFAPSGVWI